MDFHDIDQSIPRQLPVLDEWIGGHHGRPPLEHATVLCIQHQLGNHYPQARALLELGVDPANLIWIDIPYTSTQVVRSAMIEELRIPEKNFHVHSFRVLDHYPPYQTKRVQEVFARLLTDPPERLIVLDDGAYFLEAASCFARQLPRVAIVEQTTRGFIKTEESAAMRAFARNFPVIDVARAVPKRTLEPFFIGRAVCDSLARHVKHLSGSTRPVRCLVLGYGAIGRRVADFLPGELDIPRASVHVHDPVPAQQRAAVDAGYSPWNRDDDTRTFHLVIGCSGRESFTLGDRVFLEEGAVLASASSGTVELSRQDFIELAAVSEIDDISISREHLDESDLHSTLRITLVDRTVSFVNGGFPVNFDGRTNCIPGRYIQPTPVMMAAAAEQAAAALDMGLKGTIALDAAFCAWLDGAFRKELGDEAALLPASA